jgi:hypothetical protein
MAWSSASNTLIGAPVSAFPSTDPRASVPPDGYSNARELGAYSPECVEGKFSEVHLHDPA